MQLINNPSHQKMTLVFVSLIDNTKPINIDTLVNFIFYCISRHYYFPLII